MNTLCRIANKNNKDKCKAYKSSGKREINKARKLAKIEKRLAKCKAKYGPARLEKEKERKRLLLLNKVENVTTT